MGLFIVKPMSHRVSHDGTDFLYQLNSMSTQCNNNTHTLTLKSRSVVALWKIQQYDIGLNSSQTSNKECFIKLQEWNVLNVSFMKQCGGNPTCNAYWQGSHSCLSGSGYPDWNWGYAYEARPLGSWTCHDSAADWSWSWRDLSWHHPPTHSSDLREWSHKQCPTNDFIMSEYHVYIHICIAGGSWILSQILRVRCYSRILRNTQKWFTSESRTHCYMRHCVCNTSIH